MHQSITKYHAEYYRKAIDVDGKRAVFNNGIPFAAPEWYRPAYTPIEQITEDEYRYIAASGDWQQPAPARKDAAIYNDYD